MVAVGEFGRDVEGGFAAFFQELDAFGPAGDDLADGEGDRTAGFAAVEDGTVNQAAFVFDNDDVVFFRLFAVTFFGDFVLQAGSSGFHTFFSGVFFEERFAFFQVGFGVSLKFFHRFGLLFFHEFHHDFLCLGFSHFAFFAFVRSLQGFDEDLHVDFRALILHLFQ